MLRTFCFSLARLWRNKDVRFEFRDCSPCYFWAYVGLGWTVRPRSGLVIEKQIQKLHHEEIVILILSRFHILGDDEKNFENQLSLKEANKFLV
jgi:hypothetical protein